MLKKIRKEKVMGFSDWLKKWELLVGVVVVSAVIVVALFGPAIYNDLSTVGKGPPPTGNTYQYTTGLTANFQVMDDSLGTLLSTNILPTFFTSGLNPQSITFATTPIGTGVYVATPALWQAVLDANSYEFLVIDSAVAPTKYPTEIPVTVPGTNVTTETVNLSPYLVHMEERATPTVAVAAYAYNVTTGAYSISVTTTLNYTAYSKFEIDYTITVPGATKVLLGGNAYLGFYTGITVTTATLDGVTAAVYSQTVSTTDGLTGNYIVFPEWLGGTKHTISAFLSKTGTPSNGSFQLTLHDDEPCELAALRWWTDATGSVTLTA